MLVYRHGTSLQALALCPAHYLINGRTRQQRFFLSSIIVLSPDLFQNDEEILSYCPAQFDFLETATAAGEEQGQQQQTTKKKLQDTMSSSLVRSGAADREEVCRRSGDCIPCAFSGQNCQKHFDMGCVCRRCFLINSSRIRTTDGGNVS